MLEWVCECELCWFKPYAANPAAPAAYSPAMLPDDCFSDLPGRGGFGGGAPSTPYVSAAA
jgi:hypothetical protein